MADLEPTSGTEATNGAGTDANSAAATQPTPTATATHQEPSPGTNDDVITLKKDDYNNLISQRDRNHQQGNDQVAELSGTVNEMLKNQALDKAQKDYPDVPREVLELAASPEELETVGKAAQAKADELKNKAFQDLQTVGQPPASRDELAAEYEKLKGTGNLERALEIKAQLNQ